MGCGYGIAEVVEHQDQATQLAVLPRALVIDTVLVSSLCSILTPCYLKASYHEKYRSCKYMNESIMNSCKWTSD